MTSIDLTLKNKELKGYMYIVFLSFFDFHFPI